MKIFIVCLISLLAGVVVAGSALTIQKSKAAQQVVLSEMTQVSPSPAVTASPTSSPSSSPTASPSASLKPKASSTATPKSSATPKPTTTTTPSPSPKPKSKPAATVPVWLDEYFIKFAAEYSVEKSTLTTIADCESHFNTEAVNGDYLGLFQFATETWVAHRTAMGLDPTQSKRTSGEESIRTAAFVISHYGTGPWANCAP